MSHYIEITDTVEFPPHWPPHGIDTVSPKPLVPTPYTLVPCPNRRFTVERELVVGISNWSQVYQGTLYSSPESSLSDVVLKVFDESRFPDLSDRCESSLPIVYSRLPDSDKASRRLSGELMAWQEAWAYHQLESMQGESVPRFYGVFQACTVTYSTLSLWL